VVRLFKANNSKYGFISNVKSFIIIISKLCNQNFNASGLYHQVNRFGLKYRADIIGKYWQFLQAKDFY
jgi:hypothetical protein